MSDYISNTKELTRRLCVNYSQSEKLEYKTIKILF